MSFSNELKKEMKQEVPKEVKERAYQSFTQIHKRENKKKLKKKLLITGVAAAIIIPTSTMALNNSYFTQPQLKLNDMITDQVRKYAAAGKSIPLDQKITDQGITLHLKEMLIQEDKILVYYRFEQQDGSIIPYEFNTNGLHIISSGKEKGKQVASPTYKNEKFNTVSELSFLSNNNLDSYQKDRIGNPNAPDIGMFYLTDATGKAFETALAFHDKPEGAVVFEVLQGEKFPNSLTININIDRVGKTEGNWKNKILVDVEHKSVQKTDMDKDQ
ncbi:TPA: DUF4179 domain-containing protein [Bacillus cereus]|uniref:DUF4179 domain-containing protein n=1 Tax=Bacillus cereus group TaxID=86661 RepID=UPI000BF8D8EF|nr:MULTISPECIES: DUF4179 domain-containing protein [Bacillus cereus group]PFC31091.1 glycine cleavage system protein H [Bacillus cereus]PFM15213.1 glycine cleavage system protein H [Bacillus cereus]PFS48740.1 glycine cleavage system protein H [Bacillus cereus]PGL05509.1 glycine cleavage system protein H [Bacillus cereus]PGQ98199.1 glycine cleavage system protein H [Bacillus cereus]